MKVIVQQRQSLSDIALQVYGDISGVVAIARANGLSVTPDLFDGLGEISQRIFTDEYTLEFE